jgi:hypothetical protein
VPVPDRKVLINRAPVLTLWAAIVAERLGYDRDAALTLGKGLAGLNAQTKGQRLGIYGEPAGKSERASGAAPADEETSVALMGRMVPAVHTAQGLRAATKGQPVDPQSVTRYLEVKFGADLADVRAALEALALAYTPDALAAHAYALYERFRPQVPDGAVGWGAKGEMNLDGILTLAQPKR